MERKVMWAITGLDDPAKTLCFKGLITAQAISSGALMSSHQPGIPFPYINAMHSPRAHSSSIVNSCSQLIPISEYPGISDDP
jgi:hypothetical protein